MEQALITYMIASGRPPMIEDERKPWSYRGWLAYYVQAAHMSNRRVVNRWGYLFATLERECLIDIPIPRINFVADAQAMKNIAKWIDILDASGVGGWNSLGVLIEWLGWGLGVHDVYPSAVTERAAERLYRECDIGPMLISPFDYIGEFIASTKGAGWNPHGFYPTPHPICEMMVLTTMGMGEHDPEFAGTDRRLRSACDPAVGTGRMLLHASNHSLVLAGQDIDPMMVLACKINGVLYAPWMVAPIDVAALKPGNRKIPPPPPLRPGVHRKVPPPPPDPRAAR
jgi:hypothetical protein